MLDQIGLPRPPAADEINNDDKATKHSERKEYFRAWSSYQKFHQQQEALAALLHLLHPSFLKLFLWLC